MIKLTQIAIDTILSVMANDSDCGGSHLRVAVRGGGCKGMLFSLDFDNPDEDDVVFQVGELGVCVDVHSNQLLDNTEIDYLDEPFQKGFVFNNPLAIGKCGCGKSFSI